MDVGPDVLANLLVENVLNSEDDWASNALEFIEYGASVPANVPISGFDLLDVRCDEWVGENVLNRWVCMCF